METGKEFEQIIGELYSRESIMSEIDKAIEYESRLSVLRVDEDNIIQYFQDNPHAKETRKRMLLDLRDEVATAPTRPFCRESILGEINRYIDTLDGNIQEEKSDSVSKAEVLIKLGIGYWGVKCPGDPGPVAKKLGEKITENIMKQQAGDMNGNR